MATAALDLVPVDEPRGRSGLLLVIGRCRLADGDLEGAEAAFRAAVDLVAPFRAVAIVEVIAHAHLAEIDRLRGRTPTRKPTAVRCSTSQTTLVWRTTRNAPSHT